MKHFFSLILLAMYLLSVSSAFVGCSSQTTAEKNSEAVIEALYSCPNKDFAEYFKEVDGFSNPKFLEIPRPNLTESFSPYTSEKYLKTIVEKYAISFQLNCINGGISEIKEINVDEVEKGKIDATVDVVCTNPAGTKTELSLLIFLNTDENDKVYFFRPPANNVDYQNAITGEERIKP